MLVERMTFRWAEGSTARSCSAALGDAGGDAARLQHQNLGKGRKKCGRNPGGLARSGCRFNDQVRPGFKNRDNVSNEVYVNHTPRVHRSFCRFSSHACLRSEKIDSGWARNVFGPQGPDDGSDGDRSEGR